MKITKEDEPNPSATNEPNNEVKNAAKETNLEMKSEDEELRRAKELLDINTPEKLSEVTQEPHKYMKLLKKRAITTATTGTLPNGVKPRTDCTMAELRVHQNSALHSQLGMLHKW